LIKNLDAVGKLDFIFGKQGAAKLRDLNDVAKDVLTVPPGSVNTSNTASVILGTLDAMISGSFGLPLPVTLGVRQVIRSRKDAKIKKQVNNALFPDGPEKTNNMTP